ncbi:MAG: nucleotidyl transferase AbiEii/AbiGii toxin family protein [Lewinellaceae bacterium]|nr:nucleotidyl transferase AbiEii/AbiGii toxin family protein [Lewinellaceae bacterium]
MSKERIDLDKVKRLVVTALVTDDKLMEILVLKGGNALHLAYELAFRASLDLDFSMAKDFQDIQDIKRRMEKSVAETFKKEGLHTLDFSFQSKPKVAQDETKDFWGGYAVKFKFIEAKKFNELGGEEIQKARMNAIPVGKSTNIEIDISKFEYVDDKIDIDVDGYNVYVYAPRLLVLEKVRAICQQIPEYSQIIPSFSPRPRARDFYDIYTLLKKFEIDLFSEESKEILMKVFDAKRVPYDLLKKMRANKEIHKQDFASLVDTISAEEKGKLKDFEFYFNYVIDIFEDIFDKKDKP